MAARVDASGVAVDLARPPRRIVSLVPSITETLCGLGLADALVGITVYCVEPREVVSTKTRIGGEKNPDLEKIRGLEPDLVIANIEENLRDHVETLRSWSIPVWVTYPRTVAEGIRLIADLGSVTGTEARARAMLSDIEPLYERVVSERGPAASGRRLLPDLARAVHDDQPRHVHPRHAPRLRGTQRVRRSLGALSDGDPGRGRGAAAGGDPAAGRAVSIPTRAPG